MTKLAPHPRLFITRDRLERLRDLPDVPALKDAARKSARLAEEYANGPGPDREGTGHNWHLGRARELQTRVVTLLVAYHRTGERRHRDAAVSHVRKMAGWEYWSWIAWRRNDPDPKAIFDLSCGENSATLAMAYDLLHHELDAKERAFFVETARERALKPYVHDVRRGSAWFWKKRDSNWNTVCNGGAGMLALAMMEDAPEAAETLGLVEEGVAEYFRSIGDDGAWPEGIGYWAYGKRYGFMYLLSWENATGKEHPLMGLPGTSATLEFPLLFSPGGVFCSFGDVNRFSIPPVHFAVADRLGREDVLEALQARRPGGRGGRPEAAETLLLHPGRTFKRPESHKKPFVRLFASQGWGVMADGWPEPGLYLSVRGGTTEVPHSHMDLTSFFCVSQGTPFIENVGVSEYIDSTFSRRRYELYETTPQSKNVVLINGTGITKPSRVEAEVIRGRGCCGILLDAGGAMGVFRNDRPAVESYRRLFLMLDGRAALVVDSIVCPYEARIESRLHTRASSRQTEAGWLLSRKKPAMTVCLAASAPRSLRKAAGTPTNPAARADTILRCELVPRVKEATIAVLLAPGRTGAVEMSEKGGIVALSVRAGPWKRRLRLRRGTLDLV